MNFHQSRIRSTDPKAFTLIELLVVITIIAVLAGLLLPVGQRVMENSRKVSAKSTETQIVAAVNAYQTEYGQYPVRVVGDTTKDTTFGVDQASHNGTLFDVLRATNNVSETPVLNLRRVVYFESKSVKNASSPRDGFVATTTGGPQTNPNNKPVIGLAVGDLVDPWGNMYCVRIDTGYTNCVINPYSDKTATADDNASESSRVSDKEVVRTGVISWTWGADGIPGSKGNTTFTAPYTPTPGDDVDSWQ